MSTPADLPADVPADVPEGARDTSRGTRGGAGLLPGRLLIGVVGVAAGLYGLYLLLDGQRGEALVSALIWLAGGVVVHDAGIAAVALVVGLVVSRLVPRVARGPLAIGLVVLGTISIVAIPFVGRFGALDDNDTLLPRDYVGGYLLIVGLVLLGVVVGVVLRARRARPGDDPVRPHAGGEDEGHHGGLSAS